MSEWEFISGAFKNPHKRTRCTLMHLQAKKDKKLHNKYSPQKLSQKTTDDDISTHNDYAYNLQEW